MEILIFFLCLSIFVKTIKFVFLSKVANTAKYQLRKVTKFSKNHENADKI